jgi:hypothetical protein
MTIDQAVKAIGSHLEPYMDEVPERLLNTIRDIIMTTRRVVEKQVILQKLNWKKPDLQTEWELICTEHGIDPVKAIKGRDQYKVEAKAHFVRYIFLTFKYVTVMDLAKFLKAHHTTIIHLRDVSKAHCIYPPFGKSKKYVMSESEYLG